MIGEALYHCDLLPATSMPNERPRPCVRPRIECVRAENVERARGRQRQMESIMRIKRWLLAISEMICKHSSVIMIYQSLKSKG